VDVTANNSCKQPSDKVTINGVPNMTMVVNRPRARAARSRIRSMARPSPAGQLDRAENAARPARADEYKHIAGVKNSPAPEQCVREFPRGLNQFFLK
jgi:hypothetical protein